MSAYTTEYGERVRDARERARLTQIQLGNRLSLTRSSIVNIEAGRQAATAEQVIGTAQALDVDPAWLLLGDRPGVEAHIIPADAENRFRELVRGVVFGQIDERLGIAWQAYEKVLTRFPVRPAPSSQENSEDQA
ncbi:helix-turn-helix domain-containing protein [Amycolatopsis taiwanensis]|uniref:helix-turn-helix domain-containing protein n=1 Tax=Amycolatopsis taiwanensis TaxID=342230 RepID=UPI00047F45BD|nr:helix-turn-helix transcriptional regulator [Amycolatopsis taiwanensis]